MMSYIYSQVNKKKMDLTITRNVRKVGPNGENQIVDGGINVEQDLSRFSWKVFNNHEVVTFETI